MRRDAKQVLTELLVLKAQGGDETAFTQLYQTWAKDVLRFARFAIKDSQAAEEVAQESWISVAKGLSQLDDPALFGPWAFRIVRRRCVDWIRSRKSERKRREIWETEVATSVEQPVAEKAALSELAEILHNMDTDSRLLIHLYYETGLSVAEVAGAMELRTGTVKSRLFAIREKLKLKLERTKL